MIDEIAMAHEIGRLSGELELAKLRANRLPSKDAVFENHRMQHAYNCGYEAGWRGWDYSHNYPGRNLDWAYRRGYMTGIRDLSEEFNK